MRWLICLAVVLAGCGIVEAPSGMGGLKGIATLHTAQVQYFSSYGRFATSLQELGPPASGADSASAAGLIERGLASGEKGGYRFTLTPRPAGYMISAVPDKPRVLGRSYYSDQGMQVHMHIGPGTATGNDPIIAD